MLKRLVEKGRSSGLRKWISSGQQQLPFAFDIRLNQFSQQRQQLRRDSGEPMPSVMAVESEQVGSFFGEIDVIVRVEMEGLGFAVSGYISGCLSRKRRLGFGSGNG